MITKNCPECGPILLKYEEYKKKSRYQKHVKFQLRQIRRKHMRLNRHDYPWKNYGNAFLSGCYKKTLIHNGAK